MAGMEGYPFITFTPAVMIAQLVGGLWAAIPCALASMVAATYAFMEPTQAFELAQPWDYAALALQLATIVLGMAIIGALHRAVTIREAERERSAVLFQELQHRTSNNMAIVASILRLQRLALKDRASPAAKALEVAENRIEVLERLHRRLYNPEAINVPVGYLLDDLCAELLKANARGNIAYKVLAPDIRFELRRLLPIVFIVSEAVMNSVKYAFTDDRPGAISIILQRTSNAYELSIADDGQGCTDPKAQETGRGLGTRLMKLFTQQLNGTIERVFAPSGTTVRVLFPI
jgi:two-component sensor histidine kinase